MVVISPGPFYRNQIVIGHVLLCTEEQGVENRSSVMDAEIELGIDSVEGSNETIEEGNDPEETTEEGIDSAEGSNETIEECLQLENSGISKTPKVFIRMERTLDEQYYGIEDKSTLLLKPVKSHRVKPMSKQSHFAFKCDELLYKVSQEEAFTQVALEITDKAMQGTSEVLLFVGPLHSGKSFSLFGDSQNLGIIHKAIERMDLINRKHCSELKFTFSMSFIDIDNNFVRDCMAGGKIIDLPNARRKSFRSVTGGYEAVAKALQTIKVRCHTIVYIYISGDNSEQNISFQSQLIFAEIASTTPRLPLTSEDDSSVMMSNMQQVMRDIMSIGFKMACVERNGPVFSPTVKSSSPVENIRFEIDRSEDTPIRKDLFILENMFVTFARKSKEQISFEELKALGLSGKMTRPKFNHKPFCNTSKVAMALMLIFSGSCDLRILAHLIPRKEFTFENLKVLRFAVRAAVVPINIR